MHFIHDMLQFIAVHFYHLFAGVQHHLHTFDTSGGGPGATTTCTNPATCDVTGGGPG